MGKFAPVFEADAKMSTPAVIALLRVIAMDPKESRNVL